MKTVIFDLDGTLADTGDDLIAAANAVFEASGLGTPLDPVADKATAFAGARAMLRLGHGRRGGTDEAKVDADYPAVLEHYAANIHVHTVLYPGAVAAVKALIANGYATGVCTNKPAAMADDLLQRLGVRHLFASLVGAGSYPVNKPDPLPYVESVRLAGGDPARSILIGDTVTDRKTALAAGVPCVLVTFGPAGRGVAELEPEHLLDAFDDLPDLIAKVLGPS